MRFDMLNRELEYSAYLGNTGNCYFFGCGNFAYALDPEKNLLMARSVVDEEAFGPLPQIELMKISADGSEILQVENYGGGASDITTDMMIDENGDIWLSGRTEGFPFFEIPTNAVAGDDLLMKFDGETLETELLVGLPHGNGAVHFIGDSPSPVRAIVADGSIVDYPDFSTLDPKVMGSANSAAFEVERRISPGELVSLYGFNFGPLTPASATWDDEDRLPNELAGIEVLVNGQPAPLLYAGWSQVNFIAPFDKALYQPIGSKSLVEIYYQGELRCATELWSRDANPRVFATWIRLQDRWLNDPFAIALRQDGSLSDGANPIQPGEAVTIWLNGAGEWAQEVADGEQSQAPYKQPKLRARATFDGEPVTVEYFGAAPGFAAGLLQLNFRTAPDLNWPYGYRELRIQLVRDTPNGEEVVGEIVPVMLNSGG
jgi:uncharacterized protein (TIGR03437 family)